MFFARPGEYEPAGLYTIDHLVLLIIAIIGIIIAIKFTKDKKDKEITKIIKIVTIIIWSLEIIKIIFNLVIGNGSNPNNYIPLYFCSIILYTGIFSGFCKGKLKHIGDVFISTGGLIAGIAFLACPNTSLSMYPVLHYISIQSFIHHSAMIYLGILVNITDYIKINLQDFWYYSGLMVIISFIALIFNNIYDSNLMFISKDFPGTPIHILFETTGKWFAPIMIVLQATIPFFMMLGILKIKNKYKKQTS